MRVGFEPTILVFEQAKTVPALDRAATVIGRISKLTGKILRYFLVVWFISVLQILFLN
jgi:hypothetical protein